MIPSSPPLIEWKHLTSDEIAQLDPRLPVIIPIGLIEAHGPHLAVSVDLDTAEHFARAIAAEGGAILAPILNYGFADEMAGYSGTVGLTADTLASVYTDVAGMFCAHGFTRQIWLSGHGANKIPFEIALPRLWGKYPEARLNYWNYWSEAGFNQIHHADKGETEIALAVGTSARLDRVQDFKVTKPWYRIRSRHALDPASGGINGAPSQADPAEGQRVRDEIVHLLAERVRRIVAAEKST